jgi:hypothetical protein
MMITQVKISWHSTNVFNGIVCPVAVSGCGSSGCTVCPVAVRLVAPSAAVCTTETPTHRNMYIILDFEQRMYRAEFDGMNH